MSKYVHKPTTVEAHQFFYGKPMIPGVLYPADRSEGSGMKHARIFVSEHELRIVEPGDWVVEEVDEEGNLHYYTIPPEVFEALFEEVTEAQGEEPN